MEPRADAVVLDRLVEALRDENAKSPTRDVTIAITGDVFDSVIGASELVDAFMSLHARILDAVGRDATTIVIPGNHDRRQLGFLGPHREAPFLRLAEAAAGTRMFVGGTDTPFLARGVPRELHSLPAHIVTYDSSYLPRGLVGAGGTIRIEDLFHVTSRLPRDGLPLVVLMHHHLIPTPVTDVSGVDHVRSGRVTRWMLQKALPMLVSNADHEELTMTALGAGTALSALHTLGRPVLLLHGHKHMPTARMLRGMTDGCADVLLVSAGTAARSERVQATRDPDGARLWPSFNVVDFDEGAVSIDAVSFTPKRNKRPPLRRVLARVRQLGPKWEMGHATFRVSDPAPRVRRDEATYTLRTSALSSERWDVDCERSVDLIDGAHLRQYVEMARSVPSVRGQRTHRVNLTVNGTVRYSVADALCRTVGEGARNYGIGTAFECVELLCRYGAAHSTLRVSNVAQDAFASVTDLSTGRETPLSTESDGSFWTASAEHCAPRTLLRVYWPLARD